MRKQIFKIILVFQVLFLAVSWVLIKHVEHQEQLLSSINDALVKPVVQCSGTLIVPCPADLATPQIHIQIDSTRHITGVCVGACSAPDTHGVYGITGAK